MAFAGRLLRKSSYQDYVNGHVRAMNAWIRQTARREGLLLLDLEPVVSGADGERRREFAQPDGSHLTSAAYDALSRYSVPILERHFRGAR
jgi:lysophospholipase L1-like esterase